VCWRPLSSAAGAVGLEVRIPPQPGWPQPLRCTIAYSVGPDGLTVAHTARNLGSAPVPFGVGAHPYLRAGDADTDDCVLTLAATTRLPLDDKQLPAGPPEPVAGTADDFRGGRAVRGLKLDAAFGGCVPASGDTLVRHRLIAPDGGVELWAEPAFGWVQVFTPDDHPGRGRAVAVEPMTCPPDALNSGQDLIVLEPDQQWSGSWGIRPL
jgi:aldose 1-epimerase